MIEANPGMVADFAINPFDDNLMVTSSGDNIRLWKIPPNGTLGLKTNIKTCDRQIQVTSKRITKLDFHPLVDNILVTATKDVNIKIYDIERGSESLTLSGNHKDIVQSLTWDYHGSLLATACKDKFLRTWDPRQGSISQEVQAYESTKGFQAIWMGENPQILTCGFSKLGDRHFSIWDTRSMDKPLTDQKVDIASGAMTPYYDNANKLFFLAGKGDGNIRVYEHVEYAPSFVTLNEFQSVNSQSDLAVFPKRILNVSTWEVFRFCKLTKTKMEHLSFIVPRKGDQFQEDLFPPVFLGEPSLKSTEWLSGKTAIPKLKDMKPEGAVSIFDVNPEKREEAIAYRNRKEEVVSPLIQALTSKTEPSSSTPDSISSTGSNPKRFTWANLGSVPALDNYNDDELSTKTIEESNHETSPEPTPEKKDLKKTQTTKATASTTTATTTATTTTAAPTSTATKSSPGKGSLTKSERSTSIREQFAKSSPLAKSGTDSLSLSSRANSTPKSSSTPVQRKYKGGITYSGPWADGKRHGSKGTLTIGDGSYFEGEWNNNRRGKGIYHFEDGSSFEGNWKLDSMDMGKYVWPNGDTYEGRWKNGKMHGMGIFMYASGAKYNGKFVENNKEGTGSYTYPDGSIYVGNWKSDKMHGNGAYINVNGTKIEGEWENGKLIKKKQ
eukprot:TRINITY_DN7066_c0_g1_i3.p1 TRINITY_DN7066_c0_g1~~TRINITY_DN7066_c0_g1_i3.p1  ORF type:complete len:667 (-),score=143.65 TRINITY_DN7066_c0_g1_i3:144-2144(-)